MDKWYWSYALIVLHSTVSYNMVRYLCQLVFTLEVIHVGRWLVICLMPRDFLIIRILIGLFRLSPRVIWLSFRPEKEETLASLDVQWLRSLLGPSFLFGGI